MKTLSCDGLGGPSSHRLRHVCVSILCQGLTGCVLRLLAKEIPGSLGVLDASSVSGVRIFDARIKIQHDAQWRASNYWSRPITIF